MITPWQQGRAAQVPTMALFAQSHPSFPYQVVNQFRQNQVLGQLGQQFALRGKFFVPSTTLGTPLSNLAHDQNREKERERAPVELRVCTNTVLNLAPCQYSLA